MQSNGLIVGGGYNDLRSWNRTVRRKFEIWSFVPKLPYLSPTEGGRTRQNCIFARMANINFDNALSNNKMHAWGMHAWEMHAWEMHAWEMHAWEMQASWEMRCTPMRCTPVRCTPVRCTPIK